MHAIYASYFVNMRFKAVMHDSGPGLIPIPIPIPTLLWKPDSNCKSVIPIPIPIPVKSGVIPGSIPISELCITGFK